MVCLNSVDHEYHYVVALTRGLFTRLSHDYCNIKTGAETVQKDWAVSFADMNLATTFTMKLCIVLSLLLAISAAEVEDRSSPFPVGDPRNCLPDLRDRGLRIDVLPGRGWDNLRNVYQSSVLAFNYSQCRTTYDRQYLLPNGMTAIPKLQSKVDTYASIFEHVLNYTSNIAFSINFDATVYSIISGKFSTEYETFRERFFREKSIMARVQLRHHRYIIQAQVSSQLDPSFRNRVLQIAASVQSNATDMAAYLSQLLVRDYGTHYIHTTHVGAMLVKEDFLRVVESGTTNIDRVRVSAGAQADFFGKVQLGFSVDMSVSSSDREWYENLVTSTNVVTYGGPLFTTNTSVKDWEAGVESAMVAIDRDGDPIHFVINPDNLPEIPPSAVLAAANFVKAAVDKYYQVNTRRGCTDSSAKNFNSFANIDDGSCDEDAGQFLFGGVYQTCVHESGSNNFCNRLEQRNPLTGENSCPSGFTSVLLQSGRESQTTNTPHCWNTYRRCGFLWTGRCTSGRVCQPKMDRSTVAYNTYWCVRSGAPQPEQQYFFGGIFTKDTPNPITGTIGCPTSFHPVRFTSSGHVCVSADPELGRPRSFPFAGFYSCRAGNPLARRNDSSRTTSDPRECPQGFTQHLALVDNNCEVSYCLRAGALARIQRIPVQLPPFMDLPSSAFNDTQTFYLFTVDGSVWVSNHTTAAGSMGAWTVYDPASSGYSDVVQAAGVLSEDGNSQVTAPEVNSNSASSSFGTTEGLGAIEIGMITLAAVVVVLLVVNVVVVCCCVVKWCRCCRRRGRGKDFSHLEESSEMALGELRGGQEYNEGPPAAH